MINRSLDRLHFACRVAFLCTALPFAGLSAALAQGALTKRVDRLLDQPPFDRATWGVFVSDSTGKVLYQRNAERLMSPASNNKLLVAGTAMTLLGPGHRVTTSVYGTGPLDNGVLNGDLVVYGRGDPTFSGRCYGVDTLAPGGCDSL